MLQPEKPRSRKFSLAKWSIKFSWVATVARSESGYFQTVVGLKRQERRQEVSYPSGLAVWRRIWSRAEELVWQERFSDAVRKQVVDVPGHRVNWLGHRKVSCHYKLGASIKKELAFQGGCGVEFCHTAIHVSAWASTALRCLHRGPSLVVPSIRTLNLCSPFPHSVPLSTSKRKNVNSPISSCHRPDNQRLPLLTSN
jgi:hypothetical protein